MRTQPFIYALLSGALCAGCVTLPLPSGAEAKAGVLSYAREYPAYPHYHSVARQRLVLRTFQRALDGDHQALARIFSDQETFGSGDCEAWCKVPWELLHALGDDRFSEFVSGQPRHIQDAAFGWLVGLFGGTKADLQRRFPKTARLYNDWTKVA